jgi:hypothetical protein
MSLQSFCGENISRLRVRAAAALYITFRYRFAVLLS